MADSLVHLGQQQVGDAAQQKTLLPQTSAATAAATANVLAMHQRAMAAGRDMVIVEQGLVQDFQDKELSDDALYILPYGKGVSGLSIRAAEQVKYRMGHMSVECNLSPVGNDVLVTVNCIDLVTNNSDSQQAVVQGTVERHKLDDSRVMVGMRKNSKGDTVYIYPATEQEMMKDCLAMASKLRRNAILACLPPRTRSQIIETVLRARDGQFKKSKASAIRDIVDAFASMRPSVNAQQITAYLGHSLEEMTSDEYVALTGIRNGIKEGATTWKEVMEMEEQKRGKAANISGDAATADNGK